MPHRQSCIGCRMAVKDRTRTSRILLHSKHASFSFIFFFLFFICFFFRRISQSFSSSFYLAHYVFWYEHCLHFMYNAIKTHIWHKHTDANNGLVQNPSIVCFIIFFFILFALLFHLISFLLVFFYAIAHRFVSFYAYMIHFIGSKMILVCAYIVYLCV